MSALAGILPALRVALPLVLAGGSALLVDRQCARRGFLPPGFAVPWRRALAFFALALFFWIGVYGNLATLGQESALDLSHMSHGRLFLGHGLMVAVVLTWFLAGFAGRVRRAASVALPAVEELPVEAPVPAGRPGFARTLASQLGLLAPDVPRELGYGLLAGVGSWFAVILAAMIVGLLLYLVGGEGATPKQPAGLIVWIAGLPFGLRVLACLSAGFVEEIFFRGFLQPRVGLWLSTAFFVLGHLAYGQPLLLLGVTILSLIFGVLVEWRQSVWAAIAAHAFFDGVQLLVLIPLALKLLGKG